MGGSHTKLEKPVLEVSKRSNVRTLKGETRSELHQRADETEIEDKACNLLMKPWRTIDEGFKWDKEFCDHLIQQIRGTPKIQVGTILKPVTILIFGPPSAGKSSFINSIASINEGRIVNREVAGELGSGVTEKLSQTIPTKVLDSFRILDMPGFDLNEGPNDSDFSFVLSGNITPGYKFKNKEHIDVNDPNFKSVNVSLADKVHCVVLVIDSMTACDIGTDLAVRIEKLQRIALQKDIGTVLLLTKIDDVCSHDEHDMEKVFQCKTINYVMNEASPTFGIPKMNIFPVKNYSCEGQNGTKTNILLLMALRKMVEMASDHLTHVREQEIKEDVENIKADE